MTGQRVIAAGLSLLVLTLVPGVAGAVDSKGQFSLITGPKRIKVERKLEAVYSCGVTCNISARVELERPGRDLKPKSRVIRNLPTNRYGVQVLVIGRGALNRLKDQSRRSRLKVTAAVTNPVTGQVDHLKRYIRFKNPPRPRRGGGGGGGCAPGYSPCLPIVGDLDCDDIPDSQKPVIVTGSDPYRLDADGDGIGCEI